MYGNMAGLSKKGIALVSLAVLLNLLVHAGLLTAFVDEAPEEETPLSVNAIYVWWGGYSMLENATERERFFDIAEAENINTVYFNIGEDTINFSTPGWAGVNNGYRDFIKEAKKRDMEAHALISGYDDVLASPETHRPYIEAIIKYNVENPGYEFSGINWDIEPVKDKVNQMTAYIQALKTMSYQGETIVSQDLFLSAYLDAPQYLGTGDISALFHQFDLICINSYADTLDFLITHAGDGPDFCEQEGIAFTIGMETDELTILPDIYTLYEEGRDAYHTLAAQADAYFSSNYTQYNGQFLHHYDKAISWWHVIEDVTWPQWALIPVEEVAVTVTLHRSDAHLPAPVGVKLNMRDDAGNSWEVSAVVILDSNKAQTVTLYWTVPKDISPNGYDMSVSAWDIDLGGENSTLFYEDFGGDKAAMEALTLEELAAMNSLTGLRETFLLLTSTDWQHIEIA